MKDKRKKTDLAALISKDEQKVVINTSETTIATTESKIRLIYSDFIKHIHLGGNTATFFGLFLSCLIASLTSEFKDVLKIENSGLFINSAFIIACIVFFVLTIIYFIKWLIYKKKYNIDNFIDKLKNY